MSRHYVRPKSLVNYIRVSESWKSEYYSRIEMWLWMSLLLYPSLPPHAVYFTPLHTATYPWRNLIMGTLIFGLLADTLCVGLVTGLISLISVNRIQTHLMKKHLYLLSPFSYLLPLSSPILSCVFIVVQWTVSHHFYYFRVRSWFRVNCRKEMNKTRLPMQMCVFFFLSLFNGRNLIILME